MAGLRLAHALGLGGGVRRPPRGVVGECPAALAARAPLRGEGLALAAGLTGAGRGARRGPRRRAWSTVGGVGPGPPRAGVP